MPVPMLKADIDPAAWAAREMEMSAVELMQAVRAATTPDRAMDLWKLARVIEAEIAKVGDAAITRAEELCGE